MIIQLHLTNNQLATYLNDMGYETDMVDVTEWRQGNHSRDEPVTIPTLHVIDRGEKKPAKEFFERLLDKSLINLMIANK